MQTLHITKNRRQLYWYQVASSPRALASSQRGISTSYYFVMHRLHGHALNEYTKMHMIVIYIDVILVCSRPDMMIIIM